MRWGYTLSSEEWGPRQLMQAASEAEGAGFDFCSISDHFHPWVEAQGHSPFVWSVLGAVAASTERIEVLTGVTCPTIRLHPVVVAHAAATTSLLFGDRFSLGLGSGEALNEHILGHRWPTPEVRLAMLAEAVQVIREMWTGNTVDWKGEFFKVENARLFDPPEQAVPVILSGFGPSSAELAAKAGDGLFSHGPSAELIDTYRSAGGTGPRYAQINVCYGRDEETCAKTVQQVWPNGAMPGQLAQDLPTWTHFEQVAQLVTVQDASDGIPCGPDVDAIVDLAGRYVDAGYDHLYFHQIGPDQHSFIELWRSTLEGQLRTEPEGAKADAGP